MPIQITCTECAERKAISDIVRHAKCKNMVCRKCMTEKRHICQLFRVARLDDFANEESNVSWLIDNFLPSVGWTLLYGTRGYGKTTLALQLCAALQEGKPFLGRQTIQTDIMYLQADSLPDEWQEIVKRIAPHCQGWSTFAIPEACMDNTSYVASLTTLVGKVKPGFVVFDSLYNLTAPKNINSQPLLAINSMKAICGNIPFMLVHHPKQGEERASGHNSLAANCSNEWSLLRTQLKIMKGRLVKDKEIYIEREDSGLWVLADTGSDVSYNGNSGNAASDDLGIFGR